MTASSTTCHVLPAPVEAEPAEVLSEAQLRDLAAALDAVYDDVPSTCCAQSGECCALTEAEMDQGWATMFPLYRAEYARLVDHVRRTFAPARAAQLLAITEERPRRCPFLSTDGGCTVYPVRPLICRTYAVMDENRIATAAERHRGEVPEAWIRQFMRRESGMICPRVTVTQPDKLDQHARNLVTGAYERALVHLSRRLELVSPERGRLIRPLTRRRTWPVRWTWGGYNALCRTPAAWVREHLAAYWRRTQLSDLD